MPVAFQIRKSVQSLVGRLGYIVVNDGRFGYDGFSDIRKLAARWDRDITTVFDVGANAGDTAATALKTFPHAKVSSFEPYPPTFQKLQARLKGHSRFNAENLALSDRNGEAELFVYGTTVLNSLTPNAQAPRHLNVSQEGAISVRCVTLDAYCEERGIERIDVLKIDTEGFDRVVLQGADRLLERGGIGFVYVEFNDLQDKEGAFGGGLMPIDALLRPHNFRFVASYTDMISTRAGGMHNVSNALFALPPKT